MSVHAVGWPAAVVAAAAATVAAAAAAAAVAAAAAAAAVVAACGCRVIDILFNSPGNDGAAAS